jgi:hypothetical protein
MLSTILQSAEQKMVNLAPWTRIIYLRSKGAVGTATERCAPNRTPSVLVAHLHRGRRRHFPNPYVNAFHEQPYG